MRIGIFTAPEGREAQLVDACRERGLTPVLIDMWASDWLARFVDQPCDGYLLRPPTDMAIWRNTFFRRLFTMRDHLEDKCIPSLNDVLYYESKISMADIMQRDGLPGVPTRVFFRFSEAMEYARSVPLPVVVKSDGGSAGHGVKFIRSRTGLKWHVLRSFFTRYDFREIGFYRKAREWGYWGMKFVRNGWNFYRVPDSCTGYVIIQPMIEVEAEWRMIVVGDHFYGHQKLKGANGKCSGSGLVGWVRPPDTLLNHVAHWAEVLQTKSMNFDVLQDRQGRFYINELQCVFGAYAPSQMYINGVPGRFRRVNGEWQFEDGEFCQHACNLERLDALLQMLNG